MENINIKDIPDIRDIINLEISKQRMLDRCEDLSITLEDVSKNTGVGKHALERCTLKSFGVIQDICLCLKITPSYFLGVDDYNEFAVMEFIGNDQRYLCKKWLKTFFSHNKKHTADKVGYNANLVDRICCIADGISLAKKTTDRRQGLGVNAIYKLSRQLGLNFNESFGFYNKGDL